MSDTHRLNSTWRLALGGILSLTALMIVLITAIMAFEPAYTQAEGLTVTPMFDDPRLSITIAYPNWGHPTELPYDMLPVTLEREFTQTQGVQECHLFLSAMVTIMGSCTVDDGLNSVAMAELLRLLADRQVLHEVTLDLVLSDAQTSTRYVWGFWTVGWQIEPLTHPAYDDPRLSLHIAYNPPPNLIETITPATPDPRPYEERILTAFEDTPGVFECTVTLSDNPHPPSDFYYTVPGQAGLVIVEADCTVDPAQNTVITAEWLRRLATRALLDTNVIFCEDMWMCENALGFPVMELTLDDGTARVHYSWIGGWTISVDVVG